MNFLKRVLIWVGIVIIPTLCIIIVWLCTFGSFDLIQTIHHDYAWFAVCIFAVLGGFVVLCFDTNELNDIIS